MKAERLALIAEHGRKLQAIYPYARVAALDTPLDPVALCKALLEKPDLLLLDLMLPRMSGIDVCRIVRSERAVPIVMLTARDSERDTVAGLDAGADD